LPLHDLFASFLIAIFFVEPPGFGVRQPCGAFRQVYQKRHRAAALQNAIAPMRCDLFRGAYSFTISVHSH